MSINVSRRLLLHPDLRRASSLREQRAAKASSSTTQAKQSPSGLKTWEASLAGTSSVSDKLFDVDFGRSAGGEIEPQRDYRIFCAVYLTGAAAAEIGWLWLIGQAGIYLIRLVLN